MRIPRYLGATAVILAAACQSDSTSPAVNVDVNALVNQMAGNGIGAYATATIGTSDLGPGATVLTPGSPAVSPVCSYTATAQRFDCTPVTVSGVTFTRSYQLLDASGHPLSAPDPTAIAAIRTITDMKGTFAQAAGSPIGPMTIDRHEDATMSGLRTATHMVNGTATQKLDFNIAGSGTVSSNESSTTSNLLLPDPTAAAKWPLGGSITTDRTMTLPVAGSTTTVVSRDVITFDGTSVMTFVHTQAGLTMTCKVDLASTTQKPNCV